MKMLTATITSLLVSMSAYLIASSQGPHNQFAVALLAASLVCCIFTMLMSAMERSGMIVLVLNSYMVFFYIFPGMLHSAANLYPFFGLVYNEVDVNNASVVVFLFSFSVAAGFLALRSHSGGEPLSIQSVIAPPQAMRIMYILIVTLIVVLLMVGLGIGNFLQRRSDEISVSVGSEVATIMFALARSLAIVALAAAIHRARYNGMTFQNIAIVVVVLIVNTAANYPVAISRFAFFGMVLIFMPLFLDVSRPFFKIMFLVGLAIGIGTVFPFASYLQRGDLYNSFDIDILSYFMTSGDLDGFQSTINVSMLVDTRGITWGWQFLSAALFFVPRSFWPSKAWPTGVEAADNAGYSFLNISSPLPSELYADFGYFGCVFGGLAIGWMAAATDKKFLSSSHRLELRNFLIIGGVVAYEIIVMRGALLGIVGPVAVYFAVAILLTSPPFLGGHKQILSNRRALRK